MPRNVKLLHGKLLTHWMWYWGLERRWYEFDWLARRRLKKHIKRNRL